MSYLKIISIVSIFLGKIISKSIQSKVFKIKQQFTSTPLQNHRDNGLSRLCNKT